jgi:hypothetical protein
MTTAMKVKMMAPNMIASYALLHHLEPLECDCSQQGQPA